MEAAKVVFKDTWNEYKVEAGAKWQVIFKTVDGKDYGRKTYSSDLDQADIVLEAVQFAKWENAKLNRSYVYPVGDYIVAAVVEIF